MRRNRLRALLVELALELAFVLALAFALAVFASCAPQVWQIPSYHGMWW